MIRGEGMSSRDTRHPCRRHPSQRCPSPIPERTWSRTLFVLTRRHRPSDKPVLQVGRAIVKFPLDLFVLCVDPRLRSGRTGFPSPSCQLRVHRHETARHQPRLDSTNSVATTRSTDQLAIPGVRPPAAGSQSPRSSQSLWVVTSTCTPARTMAARLSAIFICACGCRWDSGSSRMSRSWDLTNPRSISTTGANSDTIDDERLRRILRVAFSGLYSNSTPSFDRPV